MSRKGFSLMEVMVSIGIMGVVTMSSLTLIMMFNKEKSMVRQSQTVHLIRTKILNYVKNSYAWEATVNSVDNDASLDCLRDPTSMCTHATPLDIATLYDIGGTPFYKPATQGFDMRGNVCPQSDANICKIKVRLYWTAFCPDAAVTCGEPDQVIYGEFNLINQGGGPHTPINVRKFNIELYRSYGKDVDDPGQIITFEEILNEIIDRKLFIVNPCNEDEKFGLVGSTPKKCWAYVE